jgi:hypothetical protein
VYGKMRSRPCPNLSIEVDSLAAYRDRVFVSESVSTGNEVLLRIGKISFLVKNLENSRFELGNVRNVVGGNTVLSLYARNDNLKDGCAIVNRFVGNAEVQGYGRGDSSFTAKTSCQSPWKNLSYNASGQHDHEQYCSLAGEDDDGNGNGLLQSALSFGCWPSPPPTPNSYAPTLIWPMKCSDKLPTVAYRYVRSTWYSLAAHYFCKSQYGGYGTYRNVQSATGDPSCFSPIRSDGSDSDCRTGTR